MSTSSLKQKMDSLWCALIARFIWLYHLWQKPSDVTYDAFVNDVYIGTLSGRDYSAIKNQVLRDPRIYMAQLLNVVKVSNRVIGTFIIGIPVLIFWSMLVVLWLGYAQEVYNALMAVVQLGPESFSVAIGGYMTITVMLWLVSLCAQIILFGEDFGFQNVFSKSFNRLIRRKLDVITDVTLTIGHVNSSKTVPLDAVISHRRKKE